MLPTHPRTTSAAAVTAALQSVTMHYRESAPRPPLPERVRCYRMILAGPGGDAKWALPDMSRTVRGKVVAAGFAPVEPQDGSVFDTAIAGGRTTRFHMTRLYRKNEDGLAARIAGVDKGRERGQDFPNQRAACP